MIRLFARPVDTQFHRSGLPFDAGQYMEAASLFPPFPRTLYGALRAWGMTRSGGNLALNDGFNPGNMKEFYGDISRFGRLAIKGPILAKTANDGKLAHNLFFPFPLDFVARKEEPNEMVFLSPRYVNIAVGWDLQSQQLAFVDQDKIDEPFAGKEVESPAEDHTFLPFEFLGRYLIRTMQQGANDEREKFQDGAANRLFCSEDRVGIARDNSKRTVRDSMLYSAQHYRMHDDDRQVAGYYLHVENHDPAFPQSGCIQIGGDFRAAAYKKLDDDDSENWWEIQKEAVVEMIGESGRFRAYFITPALFERGCTPDAPGFDRRAAGCLLRVTPPGSPEVCFRLTGACIGKHKAVGGWDVQKQRPKTLRKAVPEGSVYFFEAESWNGYDQPTRKQVAEYIFQQYNFQSWCSMEPWENGSEQGPGREGFGIALIGGW